MRPRRWLPQAAVVAVAVLVLAACGANAGRGASSGKPLHGGVVTWAEGSGSAPNFISPLQTASYLLVSDTSDFSDLMWPPLVWIGQGSKAVVNKENSLYKSITYSDGDRVVAVQLKSWDWSDGQPVTSRDLQFFYNLVKFNKESWGDYSPGEFPDNVSKFVITGERSFALHLTRSYNPIWFTFDQLDELVAIPQNAWDKTSLSGKVGNYDTTAAGAVKVWNMLYRYGQDMSTFATNPLWKVVDGPWTLQAFQTNGQATFVPNKHYSGPNKPKISKFVELPFTSNNAEFDVLLTGSTIDVGYVPLSDVRATEGQLKAKGYSVAPYYVISIDFLIPNLTQPQVGKILSQLYIRQAMQELVPERQIVKEIFYGYGVVGAGPIPVEPPSPYVSSLEKSGGPYTYNPSNAKALLSAHGWAVVPSGTDTCVRPGTASNECGAGIPAGKKLSFGVLYSSGSQSTDLEYEDVKSSMASAGITLNLKSEPFNTIVGIINPCNPHNPGSVYCSWDLGDYGGWVYSPLPVGHLLYYTGAVDNSGSYSNPEVDSLMNQVVYSNNTKIYYQYENYVARQLPFLWMPEVASILAWKTNLHGPYPANPEASPDAQNYYYTGGS